MSITVYKDGTFEIELENYFPNAWYPVAGQQVRCHEFAIEGKISIGLDDDFDYVATGYPDFIDDTLDSLKFKIEEIDFDDDLSDQEKELAKADILEEIAEIESQIASCDEQVDEFLDCLKEIPKEQIYEFLRSTYPDCFEE